MLNLQELSNLSDSKLNDLLINYDNWEYNTSTNQVSKKYKDTTLIFSLNDFSPFTKPQQADLIIQYCGLNFSGIEQDKSHKWGLMVFEDKNKKYLLLQSNSKMKSSLLLLLAVKSGLLQP